ncbi:DUF7711 family protein [Kibdelosporangium persicum]|uniref:DUF7711 family protein n=1 Tax=Kibdelosporangium persicum TaxID=2698649 RepID=UPI0015676892|nr:hypothetical protein [Kibdelosporangium persicum]
MKWIRACQHVEALATACEEARGLPLPVVQLWVFGPVLESQDDLDAVDVALAVDLPPVPWLSAPTGAAHWANATRLARNPFAPVWRSARAPIWNHFVVRPVLVWDAADGVLSDALTAVREGRADQVRLDAPSPDALRARIDEELTVSLGAMRASVSAYDEKRWRPGKLEPVADELWSVTNGYLDLLDAH